MDECVFCKIVAGEIPAYKIWEDDDFLAFLSNKPIKKGHTLIIPKKHLPDLFEMEDDHLSKLMIASKPLARALKKSLKPKTGKIGIMVAGLEVPHTHIHLISMDSEGDLDFSKAKDVTNEELKDISSQIQRSL